jgi:ABC-type bacteriocin/lantibiotic exporter with double-glycine peptidase domain
VVADYTNKFSIYKLPMHFIHYHQLNAMDCGPTCLRMVAKFYRRHYNADTLRRIAGYNKQGVSLLGISETAEKNGFRTWSGRFFKPEEARLPYTTMGSKSFLIK